MKVIIKELETIQINRRNSSLVRTVYTIAITLVVIMFITNTANTANNLWGSNGPNKSDVYCVAISPSFESDLTIFAGTDGDGFYKSINAGETWDQIIDGLSEHQSVHALKLSPNYQVDHTIFIGGWGGVYKSIDEGSSWTETNNGGLSGLHVCSLVFSPNYKVDKTIFAGTESYGVFKSTDGGTNWNKSNVGFPAYPRIFSLAVSPSYSVKDSIVFAGVFGEGVYKSTDGGGSWIAINSGILNKDIFSVAVSPTFEADGTVLAGSWGEGVYKSINKGSTWSKSNSGLPNLYVRCFTFSPEYEKDSTIFVGLYKDVYKSNSKGASWVQIGPGLPETYVRSVSVSPRYSIDSLVIAGAGAGVFSNPPPKSSPKAIISSPVEGQEGYPITLDGIESFDLDGSIVSYEWDLNNDGTYDAMGASIQKIWQSQGVYGVTLRVTDNDGITDAESVDVIVNDGIPISALSGSTFVNIDEVGSFDASKSTSFPDAIISYDWDWNYDGMTFKPSGDIGMTTSHSWEVAGTYKVAVRVTDVDGSMGISTIEVVVSGDPIITNMTPTSYSVIGKVKFEVGANYYDLDQGIDLTTPEIFIDGVNKTNLAVITDDFIKYSSLTTLFEGSHTAKVIVKDKAGISSEYLWTFKVLTGSTNADDQIDILDLVKIGKAFGSKKGQPGWDTNADLNCDSQTDIFDLVITGKNFGDSLWEPDQALTSYESQDVAIAVVQSTVHTAWTDFRDDEYPEIYYKRSIDDGATWQQDIRLTSARWSSESPAIAASENSVHVVWTDRRDGHYAIYHKKSLDGGTTWSPDTKLTESSDICTDAKVIVKGNNVYVVWQDSRDQGWGHSEIYYKNSGNNGATWNQDMRLTNNNGDSISPDIAVCSNSIHVVWRDNRDGNDEIYYKRSSDGGATWDQDLRLTNESAYSVSPSIVANNGVLNVTWGDNRYRGIQQVYSKRSVTNGDTWEPDMRMSFGESTFGAIAYCPSIAAWDEYVYLIWVDGREQADQDRVYYRISANGGESWGPECPLTNAYMQQNYPEIQCTKEAVFLVWTSFYIPPSGGSIFHGASFKKGLL